MEISLNDKLECLCLCWYETFQQRCIVLTKGHCVQSLYFRSRFPLGLWRLDVIHVLDHSKPISRFLVEFVFWFCTVIHISIPFKTLCPQIVSIWVRVGMWFGILSHQTIEKRWEESFTQRGMAMRTVVYSLMSRVIESACSVFDWVINSQSEFDWFACKHNWVRR